MTATATDTPVTYKSLASFSREGSATDTSKSLMHREEKQISMFITRNSSKKEKQ